LQLELKNFDDLLAALEVPKTQWIATSAPINVLNCDKKFLEYLDTDHNGRVRVEELSEAIRWTGKMLKDRTGVKDGSDTLTLSRLSADGAILSAAATLVLDAVGKGDATAITLAQIRESDSTLRAAHFNGDGIVAPEAFTTERHRTVAKAVMSCFDTVKNRADKAGVTAELVKQYRELSAAGKAHLGKKSGAYVWSDASEARADTLKAIRARVDEYYLQCRLIAAQSDASGALKPALDGIMGNTEALAKILSIAPIAAPSADGMLTWSKLFRGADVEALEALRKDVFDPVFAGQSAMSESQWRELCAKADGIQAWRDGATANKAIALGAELDKISDDELSAIEEKCKEDAARKEKLDAVSNLEKLLLNQKYLLRFANNFISMPELYDPSVLALFECGKLILSGREFTFSVKVPDRGMHSALASAGTMFTMYVQVVPGEGEPYQVALPVTAGTAAGVEVGKRGVFIDSERKEHDAVVVQIVTQPVSLWEAMVSPYQKIGKFISGKIEGFVGEGDAALSKQLESGYTAAKTTAETAATAPAAAPAPAAPAPAPAGANAGIITGLTVGIGLVLSAITGMLAAIAGMNPAQLIGSVIGLMAIVSLPSGLFAWLKLRKRDLAVVLEGQGWALNDRMLLGRHLGPLLTRTPARPKNSTSELTDSVTDLVERRQQEGLDEAEPTGMALKHKLLIALVVLLGGLYQFGPTLMKFAAARGLMGAPATSGASATPATPATPAAP
jgi:hypothetical protein